jgi:DNA-binding CsgD family transcriptional regulator
MIKSLADWRQELREIDAQLLTLLQRRVGLAIQMLEVLSTEELSLGDFDMDTLRLGLLLISDYEKDFPPLDRVGVRKIFRRIAAETRRLAAANAADFEMGNEERLTMRELQVLVLIAQDNPLKKIALDLNISVKTVESHKAAIMEKLNIHSSVGLTRYAIKKGLIVL